MASVINARVTMLSKTQHQEDTERQVEGGGTKEESVTAVGVPVATVTGVTEVTGATG